MRGTRQLLAGSLVLALAAPAGAGAMGGSDQPGVPGSQRLEERIAAPQGRETPVEDLLAGVLGRDRTDAGARGRALRTFLAETWQSDGEAQPEEPSELSGATARALPAGDLSGDGRADVLVDAWSWTDETHLLQAVRGSDGAELWRIESSDWDDAVGWPAGVDFTGDGADDLLIWTVSWHGWDHGSDCGSVLFEDCTTWEELTSTSTIGVRSGKDGALAWSHTYEGRERWEQHRSSGPLGYEQTERVEATNSLVLPYLSGEDLVLNVLGGVWEATTEGQDLVLLGHHDESQRLRATTYASIADGASGDLLPVRDVEDAPRVAYLQPADPDGDGLLWHSWTFPDRSTSCEHLLFESSCSAQTATETAELEMLDGATFATRWQRPVSPYAWVFPLGADLVGDGHHEILVERSSYDEVEDEWTGVVEILAGADGLALWEREGWAWPRVVGSLDGSAGADVLFASVEYEEERATAIAERVDGATGDTLFTTSETVELDGADDVFVWFRSLGDGTGDGVTDVGWATYRTWWTEECGEDEWGSYCWSELDRVESRLRAESTRTGETLYTSEAGGYAELWPAGDLDGDGAGEAFEVVWGEAGTDWTAVRLTDGVGLWNLGLHGWARLMPAGDQSGDGASEVLLERTDFGDSRVSTVVASLDGRTAAERWSLHYGDDPDPSVPPEQG